MDWEILIKENWRAGIEILVLWVLIYQLYRVMRATRGARILLGLTVILILLTIASQVLQLQVIGWLIKGATAILAFALLIIFQPELRNALARLGSTRFFSFATTQQQAFLELLADSVVQLSKKRVGALFAIERTISLEDYQSTGVELDAVLSKELTATIFHNKTALHDGGLILAQERIAHAACVFPVSQKELSDRSIGLRHRAGLGISEETDAVAVVVSEETGSLAICVDGKMERDLPEAKFRERLQNIFLSHGQSNEEMASEELDGEASVPPARRGDLVSD